MERSLPPFRKSLKLLSRAHAQPFDRCEVLGIICLFSRAWLLRHVCLLSADWFIVLLVVMGQI